MTRAQTIMIDRILRDARHPARNGIVLVSGRELRSLRALGDSVEDHGLLVEFSEPTEDFPHRHAVVAVI